MKIIFAGTPEFAAVALQSLLHSEHEVIAVYTQPDRPAGRGRKLTASPVKSLAQAHHIDVFQPRHLKDEKTQQALKALNADIMVVVAYGLLLPQAVLQAPACGCLNIHASLLPRWRGAAPIQRAILSGDSETGITIMQMDQGLDTGDMLHTVRCPIDADDTASSLHDRLAALGARAILQTLKDLEAGSLMPKKQDDTQATYAHKLDKHEADIDWQQKAQDIVRKIQAFNSWPVARTVYQNQPLRLWRARFQAAAASAEDYGRVVHESAEGLDIAAPGGLVRVLELQLPGKKRVQAGDFINAHSLLGVKFPDVL